jgi:glyoxylase-like metal-dependent hydrolase (beta-lactamase superfamily II)
MASLFLSRRSFFYGATTVLAAPFILRGATMPARAAAPLMDESRPSFLRFKLGKLDIVTLLDGTIQLDGPHPIFGQNQSVEAVAELAKANFLPPSRMEISFMPVLVNNGKEVVLFDAGNGDLRKERAGSLANALDKAGYSADQIDVVAMTHLHPDHIGGLMQGGKPVFPNARYIVGETEYQFWSSDAALAGGAKDSAELVRSHAVPLAEKMTFIKGEAQVIEGVTSVETFGHTPGHMSYLIESDGQSLMLWGDVANHYVLSIQRPDWHVVFDADKEKAAQTRKSLLDRVATDRIMVTGYHMPFPALGFIKKTPDNSYRWVAASYQLFVR